MSPEQVRGEHVDARSDVFALGCVFYEILTGKKPFDAESLHSVLYKVMQAEPPSVKAAVPSLPSVVVQVLEKALAKKPADRFQDAGEFRAVLETAREAMASGRGDEPLAGASKPPASAASPAAAKSSVTQPVERVPPSAAEPPPTPSPASSSRRPERPSSGARPRSVASEPPSGGPAMLIWIAVAVLVVAVIVGQVLLRAPAPAPTTAPPTSGQISTLAKELADTEVRNARKKLETGDYADAVFRAERALKFDPANAEAKEVLGQAKKVQDQIDAAVSDAKASTDPAKKADAFWKLLDVAPDHAAAAEIAPALDAGFKARADEARALMTEAQRAAEKAQATRLDGFRDGTALARDADTSYKARAYARAARDYMRARDRFRRVQR
jgi:tetratricopeptide (TPR) repeat protein